MLGLLIILIILLFIASCLTYDRPLPYKLNNNPLLEGYEYNTIYYCNDCEGKTFGQCTQCGSCTWIRGYDYDKGKLFAKCVKGDEHGPWNNISGNKIVNQYSRDPFYNHEYVSMFT